MFKKLLAGLVILLLSLLVFFFVIAKLTLSLDFQDVFNVKKIKDSEQNPSRLLMTIKGVDGDSAEIGFDGSNAENPAEQLDVTEKTLTEIKAKLNKLEINRWEFLTKLPASVFRFDVYLVNYSDSPNNSKKDSYYLVHFSDSATTTVKPGSCEKILPGISFEEILTSLSGIHINLFYKNHLIQTFFDKNGNFTSQSTGKLLIKPTPLTSLLVFIGIWTFWLALFFLTKQTIMVSKDIRDISEYLRK